MINLAAAEYKALFSETAYGDDGNYLGGKVPGRDGGFGHGSALLQSNAALRLMDAQRPRGDGSASSAPERRPLVQENWHHY